MNNTWHHIENIADPIPHCFAALHSEASVGCFAPVKKPAIYKRFWRSEKCCDIPFISEKIVKL